MALLAIPVLLFSLTVHEAAHALMAFWGGDDTAALQGRLTLDPTAHIDPIGTIAVPLIGMFTGLPIIGWAKPVPVNPMRLKSSVWGVYVALAGPGSNILQALIAGLLLAIMRLTMPEVGLYGLFPWVEFTISSGIMTMLFFGILINLILAIFNLIPLPPLDGHWVVNHFFLRPGNLVDRFYTTIAPISYFVLIVIVMTIAPVFGYIANGVGWLFWH